MTQRTSCSSKPNRSIAIRLFTGKGLASGLFGHLAFWADSTDQVETLTAGLRDRGVLILYEDRGSGETGAPDSRSVFFEDPDRIKVEIVGPREPSPTSGVDFRTNIT